MEKWNKTELDSYLMEISAAILQYKDDKGESLVNKIRDAAGQVCHVRNCRWSLNTVVNIYKFNSKDIGTMFYNFEPVFASWNTVTNR